MHEGCCNQREEVSEEDAYGQEKLKETTQSTPDRGFRNFAGIKGSRHTKGTSRQASEKPSGIYHLHVRREDYQKPTQGERQDGGQHCNLPTHQIANVSNGEAHDHSSKCGKGTYPSHHIILNDDVIQFAFFQLYVDISGPTQDSASGY